MAKTKFFALVGLAGVMLTQAGVTLGQTLLTDSGQAYPHRPIRILTSEPAGINDVTTRIIAQGLAAAFGRPIVVDKLKALGVASAQPSLLAPGLPTISDAGLPGYEYVSMWGILAPARTPAPIIKRINQETVAFLKKPDTRQRLQDAGIEAIGSTPETFAEALKKEMKVLGKLIKDLKIRSE